MKASFSGRGPAGERKPRGIKAALVSVTLLIAVTALLPRLLPSATPDGDTWSAEPLQVSARAPRETKSFIPSIEPLANDSSVTNRMATLLRGDIRTLMPEQLAPYLERSHRSAASLLAAFQITEERAFLTEAREKFPNDPQVTFAAALDRACAPAQRRQWLEGFKQSAPGNALANYLSASDYLKSGQTDLALQEFANAEGKPGFSDYWLDRSLEAEQAYRSVGLSEAEALAAGLSGRVPEFVEFRQLTKSLTDLVSAYQQAGDTASAQAAVQHGLALGAFLDQPDKQFSGAELRMGLDIESHFLSLLDPNTPCGDAGQTARSLLDQMIQRRQALEKLRGDANALLSAVPEQQAMAYARRVRIFGMYQASTWFVDTYGRKEFQAP